jgi:hypothetical protein
MLDSRHWLLGGDSSVLAAILTASYWQPPASLMVSPHGCYACCSNSSIVVVHSWQSTQSSTTIRPSSATLQFPGCASGTRPGQGLHLTTPYLQGTGLKNLKIELGFVFHSLPKSGTLAIHQPHLNPWKQYIHVVITYPGLQKEGGQGGISPITSHKIKFEVVIFTS